MALELRRAGWPKARALTGGWKAWQEAGMPIDAGEPRADRATENPESEKAAPMP